jgi:hypothetical protein
LKLLWTSCAFWLDRAAIDRLTALKIIVLGPDPEARSAVLTLGSGGLLNERAWGAGTEEVTGSIAVGTSIAERPPLRSVRAGFPHTAPTSGV